MKRLTGIVPVFLAGLFPVLPLRAFVPRHDLSAAQPTSTALNVWVGGAARGYRASASGWDLAFEIYRGGAVGAVAGFMYESALAAGTTSVGMGLLGAGLAGAEAGLMDRAMGRAYYGCTPSYGFGDLAGDVAGGAAGYAAGQLLGQAINSVPRHVGGSAARNLATGTDEAVFWTGIRNGDAAAAKWVSSNGGATLETTMAARGVKLPAWDASNPSVVAAWRNASAEFAAGARGNVRVLQGDVVRINSVWAEVEFPAIKGNLNVTSITAVNPETGTQTLLWSR
jgi:hypothetical protein